MPTDYFANTINDLIASVIAIETELGILPAGAYATVRTRLDILETRPFTGGGAGFSANGDLSGSNLSQMVIGIQGIAVPVPSGTNTILTYNAGAYTWNVGGGGSGITQLTGDVLAGPGSDSQVATVVNVHGVSYPASPATNTVPVVTASNVVTYQAIANAQISVSAAIAGTKISPNFGSQNISTTGSTTLSGSLSIEEITTTASTYDVLATDQVIFTDSTSNTINVVLPVPSAGRQLFIKDKTGQAGTNNVTISHNSAETIDGSNSVLLSSPYASLTLVSDSINWSII
jgi:hypothetical protein